MTSKQIEERFKKIESTVNILNMLSLYSCGDNPINQLNKRVEALEARVKTEFNIRTPESNGYCFIECKKCYLRMYRITSYDCENKKELLLSKWNTRPSKPVETNGLESGRCNHGLLINMCPECWSGYLNSIKDHIKNCMCELCLNPRFTPPQAKALDTAKEALFKIMLDYHEDNADRHINPVDAWTVAQDALINMGVINE